MLASVGQEHYSCVNDREHGVAVTLLGMSWKYGDQGLEAQAVLVRQARGGHLAAVLDPAVTVPLPHFLLPFVSIFIF